MQSANVVIQIHNALRPENRAALMGRKTITSVIDIAWKVAAKASTRSN
jgi:hypothetical protein